MRKREKKMAEEFLSLLDNAHREIRRALNNGETGQGLALLEQCQQGAISLGELIENTEGESCPAIALLESYCEMVYQFHEELLREPEVNGNKAGKKLHRQLIQIENSVRNDIRLRLEIAFLPYNASMWDSLESVWQAADADPDCDAYVVPIPYYDKNPDGSLGKYHYEGSLFPPYVPIVPYYSYPIEERRPDIIYIHNPYDEQNYVTSVAPNFYSSELKKWTDCLVYVPYFIHAEPKPDKFRPESIAHFVLAPGVLNADKVILPSELIRSRYIDITLSMMGEASPSRKTLERKMLGLGSPKYDRIAAVQSRGVVVPEQWRTLIQKKDGSSKKVVFYNTGIGALLRNNEKWIEKIGEVLAVFHAHQDFVTLLWRPHPLIEATLKSMRSAFLAQYLRLKDSFVREAWGIYDDSVDIDRAVALSDMFYGDGSSVARLFQSVAKPVKVQSFKVDAEVEFAAIMNRLAADSIEPKKRQEAGPIIHRTILEERLMKSGVIPCENTAVRREEVWSYPRQ